MLNENHLNIIIKNIIDLQMHFMIHVMQAAMVIQYILSI